MQYTTYRFWQVESSCPRQCSVCRLNREPLHRETLGARPRNSYCAIAAVASAPRYRANPWRAKTRNASLV
jgi:hypothetical protein